ncbi:MAG TPA: di-heme oxidoredictase family protein [Bryobacteraceae bacterium]|nr:di-heme oxidoredictase family protein [Bryobacteraceae bacterium]
MIHTGISSRFAVLLLCTGVAFAQRDPGPRGGPAGAGGYYPTLGSDEQTAFMQAIGVFEEVEAVPDGLGPTFNGNSCAMCHAQPAVGGSSPGLNSPQNPAPNPQVALATLNGATNTVPPFITAAGPVREARFISTNPSNFSAPLDGGVHGLFTIQGRADAVGCTLAQPNFAAQMAVHNVIFRIPTPLFGLGLVENTPDATLQANLSANPALKNMLGIRGRLNTSGNDGTVTRFGWKAQNKSLLVFSGEAYNVEMGVSNELFTNERTAIAGCMFNPTPEDYTHMTGTTSTSDVVNFSLFMRLLAPPTPTTASASELNGQTQFVAVGCALCHSTTLTTAQAPFTGMSNVTYHPYSDFGLHHMGANLSDGVNQGIAGPDEFRTAPLWGVGQRLFFLHDGRTSDLLQAIEAHSSPSRCSSTSSQNQVCGSEANTVINKFNSLPTSVKQDILNFLRSL